MDELDAGGAFPDRGGHPFEAIGGAHHPVRPAYVETRCLLLNTTFVPNSHACCIARLARSEPLIPRSKPRVVPDQGTGAGLATGNHDSTRKVRRPSDAAYTAAASPAGPPPMITKS